MPTTKWSDILAKMPPERQAEIKEGAQRLREEDEKRAAAAEARKPKPTAPKEDAAK